MRAAIVYDTNTPFTTGVYFHRAFQELGFITDAFHHDNVNSIPEGYDIYFIVDSGPQYKIPVWKSGPSYYYSIDVHLDFENRFEMAKSAHLPVMAQFSCGAQKATDKGLPVLWMPLACDPWIHQDYQLERDLDIAFVGHLYEDDGWRMTIKQKLLDHGFAEDKIFIGNATKEEMGRIYSRAKIVLNHTVRDNKQDINMRVFEAMSSGAYLLTQRLDNQDMEKVIPSNLYGAYTTEGEMFGLINKILADWPKYQEIAQTGKLFVRSHHTYAGHLRNLITNIAIDQAKKEVEQAEAEQNVKQD